MSELKKVVVYTDGACIDNPGPGGYGVVLLYEAHRGELSGGFRRTTNNRMEIMAAIVGLQALKSKYAVTIYSDSKYLVDSIAQGWAQRWRANGWMRNAKDKAINSDLWESLLELCAQHEVEFRWVKGHANDKENGRCDILAMQAAKQKHLPIDEAYENGDVAKTALPGLFD